MKNQLSKLYGRVLAEVRKERDLTQDDVSADIKIDVSKIETGERLIRIDTLYCLCWYYKVSISDVVYRVDRMVREKMGDQLDHDETA